jgi:tetratricopeptide (TPR) repeat protein
MVAKRKLTIESLSKLGRRKLAELLIVEAAGNHQLTQTLNLAISAEEGPAALGASLGMRLATLAKSRFMLSYNEGRELIAELDGLRTAIVETLGPQESRLAFELLLKLIDLHPSILERVDDSSGRVGNVFRTACDDLGPLAQRASIEPDALAATVFQKVTSNSYGIYDGLIISLDAALGRQGRATLRGLLLQQRQQYLTQDKLATIAAGRYDFTVSCLSLALRDIAESEGDADAFIDSYQGSDLANPRFASEIALQLLRSGRAEEALTYLERASPSTQNPHFGQTEWTNARIAVLDALREPPTHPRPPASRLSPRNPPKPIVPRWRCSSPPSARRCPALPSS